MPKVMLINVTHAEESRVGIVADKILESFEIETFSREHLKGNIYKGVVHRIHPALEAAFVDIGAERDAFLPLDEICFRNLPAPPPTPRENGDGAERRRPRIKDVLKPGEEVLVQIVKEEFGSKPPTLSTFYSLPGRYLVLLPGSEDAGISRKIEGPERARLRELIDSLKPPEGFGVIVRTAAGFDEGTMELERDLAYLVRLWEKIQHAASTRRAPAMIYREHDLVLRNIRDYFTPDIDEIYIDNEDVFQRAREFLRDVMPGKEAVLHLYEGDQPIFSHFNVETQIESIYKRRVPLKSGGSIVIDGTEALTAIDVNSGRSVRGTTQEETAHRTNVEAATEIARQLRLRDLGGLVVIDFIDMRAAQHIAEVEKTLRDAMRPDKARHDIGRISQFGLLEISRQRLRPAAAATSYTACPMCEGHGLVRTTESAALVALRKIHHRVAQGDVSTLRVSLPPDVAVYVLNQKRDDVAQLERRYAARIQVVLKESLMPHQSEFEVRTRVEAGAPELPQIRLGGVASSALPAPTAAEAVGEVEVPSAETTAAPPPAGGAQAAAPEVAASGTPADAAGRKRRRRRGRRRGRGRQAAVALADALSALASAASLVPPPGPEAATTAAEATPGAPAARATAEAAAGAYEPSAEIVLRPAAAAPTIPLEAPTPASAAVGDEAGTATPTPVVVPGPVRPAAAATEAALEPARRRATTGRRGRARKPAATGTGRSRQAATAAGKTGTAAPRRGRTKAAEAAADSAAAPKTAAATGKPQRARGTTPRRSRATTGKKKPAPPAPHPSEPG